jgi:hypothetical protein
VEVTVDSADDGDVQTKTAPEPLEISISMEENKASAPIYSQIQKEREPVYSQIGTASDNCLYHGENRASWNC